MKAAVQEHLITARRNQILDAAARVFAQKGFHPTTIKDIAREAGIADGTIYNYFDNKPALLLGIFERMREAAVQNADFTRLSELDARSFIHAYLRQALIALKGDNFALLRVILSEMMVNQELRTLYEQNILQPTLAMAEIPLRQWVEARQIRPIDISLTVRVISSMVLGLMIEHVMGDAPLEAKWDSLPEFITDLMFNGLRNDSL